MKNLLRYRFVSLKEARFYVFVFSFFALAIVVSSFLYFMAIPKKESFECSLVNGTSIQGQEFAFSMHMTLLTTLPAFSYCLGLVFGHVFISSDFEKKRLKMIFGSSLGKRTFYRNGVLASNLVGLSFVFAYWISLPSLAFGFGPFKRKKGIYSLAPFPRFYVLLFYFGSLCFSFLRLVS